MRFNVIWCNWNLENQVNILTNFFNFFKPKRFMDWHSKCSLISYATSLGVRKSIRCQKVLQ